MNKPPFYRFTVPGQPIPKGRPRHNTKTNTTYTPQRTSLAEEAVGVAFRQGVVGYGPPRTCEFVLGCLFYVKRDDADIDNLIKMVMDGLQGFAWVNDRQVKAFDYSEVLIDRANPRTIVTFSELRRLPH